MLANIYLHEALDKWWAETVIPHLRGPASLVRFADDFVMVFESRGDAERVLKSLVKRMEKYELIVHPEKTRLVRYGRPGGRGEGPKPGSFDFLGFTHFWTRSRKGKWFMRRKTSKKRASRSLKALNQWLRSVRHLPVSEQSRMLGSKLRGHLGYYGVAGNSDSLSRSFYEVRRLWKKWLGRRSQRGGMTREMFNRLLLRNPLPPARLRRGAKQLRWANL